MARNKIQKDYIVAMAMWNAANTAQKEKFNGFLRDMNLTEDDLDGENYEILSAAYEVVARKEIENSARAWDNLKLAEAALIEFGISIAPANIRKTLRKGLDLFYKEKREIIDTLMRLDVNTIPQALRA